MDCMAKYIDQDEKEKNFYWNSKDYGTRKDCLEAMKKEGIEPKEIKEIWSSD